MRKCILYPSNIHINAMFYQVCKAHKYEKSKFMLQLIMKVQEIGEFALYPTGITASFSLESLIGWPEPQSCSHWDQEKGCHSCGMWGFLKKEQCSFSDIRHKGVFCFYFYFLIWKSHCELYSNSTRVINFQWNYSEPLVDVNVKLGEISTIFSYTCIPSERISDGVNFRSDLVMLGCFLLLAHSAGVQVSDIVCQPNSSKWFLEIAMKNKFLSP